MNSRNSTLSLNPTLVILSPGFPGDEADTTCLPAQQTLVRLLRSQDPGLNIVIIAFQYPFTDAPYNWNGIPVIPLKGMNKGRFHRLLNWARAWMALWRISRQRRVIGIFSFWCTECALLGKWFGRLHRITHRCWILGQDARGGNVFVKWIRPAAADLVALSDFVAGEFQRNYGIRPAHVIPSGIDPAEFAPASGNRSIDVLAVGSLIPLKQHDVFLEVVARLRKVIPDVHGLICGKGPEEDHLRAGISRLGLENNIRLAGELPHPEVLRCMQQTRILLHPSSYEGFGTVCLEALYAGADVISFCRPMTAFISNWYIAADAEDMTGKALELLQRPEGARAPVMAYSMKDNVREVLRLFGADPR
jgi:glycosyltransferase involved in cell wall biosynthesis